MPTRLKAYAGRLLFIALGIVCLSIGWWLMPQGLERLSESRQIERLNVSPIASLMAGPHRVRGETHLPPGMAVQTPFSGSDAIYVRYQAVKKTRENGRIRTRTIKEGIRVAPQFLLRDPSGSVVVNMTPDAEWHLERSYHQRDGDITYSEWSLPATPTPGVTLIGNYADGMLDLSGGREYGLPNLVVHGQDLAEAGGWREINALLMVAGSVVLLALGTAWLLQGIGIHRYWVFITLISVLVMGYLIAAGGQQLTREWQQAQRLAETRIEGYHAQPLPGQNHLIDVFSLRDSMAASVSGLIDGFFHDRMVGRLFPDPREDSQALRDRLAAEGSGFTPNRLRHASLGWGIAGVAALLAVLALWSSLRQVRAKRLIENLILSTSGRLSYGAVKKQGTLHGATGKHLHTPIKHTQAVAYRYRVERRESGHGQKVTWALKKWLLGKSTGNWITVTDETRHAPLYLRGEADDEQAPIMPDGADLHYMHRCQRTARENGVRYRYTEWWINDGDDVVVVGHAGLNPDRSGTLAIHAEAGTPFIISARGEKALYRHKAGIAFGYTALSLALMLLAVTALFTADGTLSPDNLLTTSLTLPLFLLVCTGLLHYNDLVYLKHQLIKRRQNVLTQLQKRADLWPAVENVVKAYLNHEATLQQAITDLRRQPVPQGDDAALTARLADEKAIAQTLRLKAEDHPQLHAEPAMRQLQTIMAETESHLAFLRDGHLRSIEAYNTRIGTFPDLLLARPLGFKTQPLALT